MSGPTLALHQECGQKPGQPGKAWPDHAFPFSDACLQSMAWESLASTALAKLSCILGHKNSAFFGGHISSRPSCLGFPGSALSLKVKNRLFTLIKTLVY